MSFKNFLIGVGILAVLGSSAYYLRSQSVLSGDPATIVQQALLNSFDTESVAFEERFDLSFESTEPLASGTIVLTSKGGGNKLTSILPDLEYQISFDADIKAEGQSVQAAGVFDFLLLDKILYFQLSETKLAGLPSEVAGIADFYLAFVKDKWYEFPLVEIVALAGEELDLETELAQQQKLKEQLRTTLKENPIFQDVQLLSSSRGKTSFGARLDSVGLTAVLRKILNFVAEKDELAAAELPDAEEMKQIESVLTAVIAELPPITLQIDKADLQIYGVQLKGEFDLADLSQAVATAIGEDIPTSEEFPQAKIAISMDASLHDFGKPYAIIAPTDTVNFGDLMQSFGALVPSGLEADNDSDAIAIDGEIDSNIDSLMEDPAVKRP